MKVFGHIVLLASLVALAACDPASVQGKSGVAVIDLAVIAKATGQEDEIRVQAEGARGELTEQLHQLAISLEEQIKTERDKIGNNPSEADAQRLRGISIQAQQQINSAQIQAQAQASQFEQTLVNDYRDRIEPLAKEIASGLGASIVVTADANVIWFDPTVDITDEVIAAWRALPAEEETVTAPAAEAETPEPAQVPEAADTTPAE
jgi:Skp family chaperone for outer membrane proteins